MRKHVSLVYITCFQVLMPPIIHLNEQCVFHVLMLLIIQTGLGDSSSDVLQFSTSITVLTGTDLPNVFLLLLLCSATPMSASVIKFRDESVKSLHKLPVVLSSCPPPSSNIDEERVKSMHDLSVPLLRHGQSR